MKAAELRLGALVPGAALALGLLAACGETGAREAESQVERRDSAGVEIVTSRGPAWAEAEAWRLGPEPTLDIGTVEGPPEEQLFGLTDALRLADGRIAVANRGAGEIRLYDSAGAHLWTAGGEGEGPGEFRRLETLDRAPADSLLAWDSRTRRLSLFSPRGEFARSITLEPSEGGSLPGYIGRFADGRYLVLARKVISGSEMPSSGQRRDSIFHLTYGPAGTPRDTVLRSLTRPTYLDIDPEGRWIRIQRVPFAPGPQLALHQSRVLTGTGQSYEVRVLDPAGRPQRILRLTRERPPLTDDIVAAWTEDRLAGIEDPESGEDVRAMLGKMELPERIAAFAALMVDAEGNVWLRATDLPGRERSRWMVFGASGAFLGELTMPPRFTPYEIGSDYVLGRWEDELEVEHVRLYPLLKPGEDEAGEDEA